MRVRRKRLGNQSVRCGAQEAEGRPGASGSDCQGRRAVSTELGMLIGTHMDEHQRYGVDITDMQRKHKATTEEHWETL